MKSAQGPTAAHAGLFSLGRALAFPQYALRG